MQNPFGSSEFGSYANLQKRLQQHMQTQEIDQQMTDLIVKSFEDFFGKANLVISRPERKRLLAQVTDLMFEDVKKKLNISREE